MVKAQHLLLVVEVFPAGRNYRGRHNPFGSFLVAREVLVGVEQVNLLEQLLSYGRLGQVRRLERRVLSRLLAGKSLGESNS